MNNRVTRTYKEGCWKTDHYNYIKKKNCRTEDVKQTDIPLYNNKERKPISRLI